MKPYGMKRNWNAVEDVGKNGKAERPSAHSKTKKIYHRIARRHFKKMQRRTRGNEDAVD